RSQSSVGPDFQDKFIIIGPLTDAGIFDRVLHARDWREDRIDRDQTDRLIGALVFLTRCETAADTHFEFGVKLMFLVERADHLLGIEYLVALDHLNVTGSDFAFLVYSQRKFPRLMIVGFKLHLLEVEDDIGHVFDHTRKSGELMLCPGDLYRGDGRAFQRG